MSRFDRIFADRLDTLSAQSMRRELRASAGLLDFSSNDYLGLRHHPTLIERACEWAARYGTGAGASRLVTGTSAPQLCIETRLADFKGCEAALLFSSGWQANAATLAALFDLTGSTSLVFTDRLNHASLHQGCRSIRQIRFRHNDLDHLQELLAGRRHQDGPRFILTESVFSMDGDRADVGQLAEIARNNDAFLYLDEAHATGVLGPQGRGLSYGVAGIGCVMGTFSKALGSFGAYVAGSRLFCDFLINRCSGFIHTTALPPPVLGAIDAALDLVTAMDAERAMLAARAQRLRDRLHVIGIETAGSTTQIVPAILGSVERTLAASAALADRGFLGIAIRPPTVPSGSSRIRFALSTAHSEADFDRLLEILPDCLLE